MGMGVSEFYAMTPRQFANKSKGFFDQFTEVERAKWERMRFSTTALINIQLAQGKKIDPQKLIKFPWDQQQKKKTLSVEEFEALIGK